MKYRLTGAAVLIGFAVIVLPILLGGPGDSRDAGDPGEGMGTGDTKVFRSNITPIGGEAPAVDARDQQDVEDELDRQRADTPPAKAATGKEQAGEDQTVVQADAGDDDQEREPAAPSDESGDRSAGESESQQQAAVTRGWIVQVGTFKNPDNVKKLSDTLESNGFGSSTTEVETSEGTATRVWVGPFATRVEAARAKTQVKQRTGSEGLIVAYP